MRDKATCASFGTKTLSAPLVGAVSALLGALIDQLISRVRHERLAICKASDERVSVIATAQPNHSIRISCGEVRGTHMP